MQQHQYHECQGTDLRPSPARDERNEQRDRPDHLHLRRIVIQQSGIELDVVAKAKHE